MHDKHKYEGDDLKEIEYNFKKVAGKNPLRTYSFAKYSLKDEFNALVTECRLVNLMYKLNDFRASCYAYTHTMRKIEEMLEYCYKYFATSAWVKEWCGLQDENTEQRQQDGSVKRYSHLAYIYDVLRWEQMAIAARYFIEYNIQYLERDKTKKAYPSRKRILESAIWWFNQGLLGRFGLKMPTSDLNYQFTPSKIVFSTFPSSGKSYLVNTMNEMYSELAWIIYEKGGFLRVGNEQGNIFAQSAQTKNLIENKRIIDIYPENRQMIIKGIYRPFSKSSDEEWIINGVKYTPTATVFKTRDSAINSVRCCVAAMDDPSRGQQEATNSKLHNDIVQLFRGDFSDRFEEQDDQLILLTGTMFNPNDVFAQEIGLAMDGARPDPRFKNTYISADNKTIVIINDCENEFGESAYPEFISTEALVQKRNGLDPYSYACIWRQKPIPAEGLIFDYDFLKTYDELPTEDLNEQSIAYIDPTRRSAKDFFSMPILRQNKKDELFYFTDCIFVQKASIDLYGDIINKIIKNKIVKLIIEENVDGSLAEVIKMKLKALDIRWCEVITKYNTVNKAQRIALMAGTVKENIVFPSKRRFAGRTQMGVFMNNMTQYSADVSKNLHDDAPDSICGVAENFIFNVNSKNVLKTYKQLPF